MADNHKFNESTTCGVTFLAQCFGLSAMRIQQLATDGVIVRAGHGQYRLMQSIQNMLVYQREKPKNQHSGDNSEDGQSYEAHRARLTKAKADMAEIEAEVMKGKAHDAEAVAAVWADMIGNARAKLLALPTTLASQLEGMTIQERQEAIQLGVNDALKELAEYSPEIVTQEYVAAHSNEPEEPEVEGEDEAAE